MAIVKQERCTTRKEVMGCIYAMGKRVEGYNSSEIIDGTV
jgi:hypothetical protein